MKKETFTEKLIKRTYGISDPLDEYKRSYRQSSLYLPILSDDFRQSYSARSGL